MKGLFLILAILFCASCVHAEFLACDPSTDVITQVQVEITQGGTTTTYPGIYNVVGTDARIYDLTGLPNGSFSFRVRWATVDNWWSEWSEKKDAVKAGKPGTIRIK